MYPIIFPSHPLDHRQVDPAYALERDAFHAAGHEVSVIDVDALATRVTCTPFDRPVIYRGWMLTPELYQDLDRCLGHCLQTTPTAYVASHHLPRWYPALKHLTMESQWVDSDQAVATFIAWQARGHAQVFLKDYVKSITTHEGSVATSVADVERVLADLCIYRTQVEGGIVLREWTDLMPDSEVRGFVLEGKLHLPHDQVPQTLVSLMEEVCRCHTPSQFFSVDAAFTATGRPILIEVGDGQVSQPRGWSLAAFVALFD